MFGSKAKLDTKAAAEKAASRAAASAAACASCRACAATAATIAVFLTVASDGCGTYANAGNEAAGSGAAPVGLVQVVSPVVLLR